MSDLKDKVVLITGASSGIGAGAAKHLATLGCQLSLTGRNVDGLNKVAKQCEEVGLHRNKILIVPGELSKDDDIKNIMEKTIQKFKTLDVLVNNAGFTCEQASIQDTDMAKYDLVMNVNTRSAFYLTKLAIPHLIKTKGNIINISSLASTKVFPQSGPYCMSKAAMDMLTRMTAAELAQHKVRCNSINPAIILTPIAQKVDPTATSEKMIAMASKLHPIGRIGTVEEVAKAIAYLASDDTAGLITGSSLLMDGGMSIASISFFEEL